MDIETSEAIETLRADIRRVESSLGERIGRVELRVGAGELTLQSEMRQIRAEMAGMREGLMRHSRVLYESLRDDIRMIAEGLVSLDRKVDSLRRPTDLQ